jgi:DNA-binding transcriptional ArsR family regulator
MTTPNTGCAIMIGMRSKWAAHLYAAPPTNPGAIVSSDMMSGPASHGLDATFHALAHPVRRAILAQLAEESATILEIAGRFDLSLNGVSKHVKVLEQAGLIQRNIRGRTHHCSLDATRLRAAGAWIEYYRPYWEHRLDALERFLSAPHDSSDSSSSDDL